LREVNPQVSSTPKTSSSKKPLDYSRFTNSPGLFVGGHVPSETGLDKREFSKFLQASPEIGDQDFWHKDSNRAAAYGSMKGFDDLYELLLESINQSRNQGSCPRKVVSLF